MGAFTSEWLVTDPRGAFAMGTREGIRIRKYHGFFMGIPGRSETAYLVDLDLEWDGKPIWPHCYFSPEGPLIHPDLEIEGLTLQFEQGEQGPVWQWGTREGKLQFKVEPSHPGGIVLSWKWHSKSKKPTVLKIRGFWGMRDLHATGGKSWAWKENQAEGHGRYDVVSEEGRVAHCLLRGNWTWHEDPQWYQNFHYTEEVERGYPADENLYSAGILEVQLNSGETGEWVIAQDAHDLTETEAKPKKPKPRSVDFLLTQPAGVVAGYPWFGEWGRDTFVSLPGIAIESVRAGADPDQVWNWAQELLHRWGSWIDQTGMLPNIIEKNGKCQWQSADATLWWCHSLAVLWAFSLSTPFPFVGIEKEFLSLLKRAIESIRNGQHRFLQKTEDQLLRVTEPHSTWMDAKVNGVAVTPRTGILPEINALWFEACCLQAIWTDQGASPELENLGRKVLQIREPDRPNGVFLHSLPLAPSFVLKDWDALERDLIDIAQVLWTPVGLRSLSPSHPNFHAHCIGTQEERDRAYHQGTVWGWLGGHFEMARHRLNSRPNGSGHAKEGEYQERFDHSRFDKMFTTALLKDMPIEGHIPEIFDAEPPFTPRGAPAQAWSLACLEESKARRRLRTDSKISKVLAQRWLGRKERQVRAKRPSDEAGVIR